MSYSLFILKSYFTNDSSNGWYTSKKEVKLTCKNIDNSFSRFAQDVASWFKCINCNTVELELDSIIEKIFTDKIVIIPVSKTVNTCEIKKYCDAGFYPYLMRASDYKKFYTEYKNNM